MRGILQGVGFLVGAGIPKGKRVNTFVECGCCGSYHRTDFMGDCREDRELDKKTVESSVWFLRNAGHIVSKPIEQ